MINFLRKNHNKFNIVKMKNHSKKSNNHNSKENQFLESTNSCEKIEMKDLN